MPDIFVSVPSYNDYDLPRTLDSAIRASSGGHQLHFGVCEQVTEYVAAWALGARRLPQHCSLSYALHGEELLGIGGARAVVESMYAAEAYMLMIDAHTRFEPNWDDILVRSVDRLPSEKSLLSAIMSASPWDQGQVPMTECDRINDEGFPSYQPKLLGFSERDKFFPARHAHVCSLFGRAWCAVVPYDPYIVFEGEEPTYTARLWTAGYDLYHMAMPIMHGAIRRPGRPWERPGWHDLDVVSKRRCRVLLGAEECEPSDPALIEIDRYGLGGVRSLSEWQAWSGFDYANRTVDSEWGEWRKPVVPAVDRLRGAAVEAGL